jgi:hypothetical protein
MEQESSPEFPEIVQKDLYRIVGDTTGHSYEPGTLPEGDTAEVAAFLSERLRIVGAMSTQGEEVHAEFFNPEFRLENPEEMWRRYR